MQIPVEEWLETVPFVNKAAYEAIESLNADKAENN